MSNNYYYENVPPIAPLKIAALEGCMELARNVERLRGSSTIPSGAWIFLSWPTS